MKAFCENRPLIGSIVQPALAMMMDRLAWCIMDLVRDSGSTYKKRTNGGRVVQVKYPDVYVSDVVLRY